LKTSHISAILEVFRFVFELISSFWRVNTMPTLNLDTIHLIASLEGENLPVSNRLFRFLSFLALHAQRPPPKPTFIDLEEVSKLEGYSALSKSSVRNSVRRDIRSLEDKGHFLIVSPPSKGSEFFRLADAYTVVFDRATDSFSADLGLESSGMETGFVDALEFYLECASLEALLEGEQAHEAHIRLEGLLVDGNTSGNTSGNITGNITLQGAKRCRMLLYQSQILERRGLLTEAWEWLNQAEVAFASEPLASLKPLLALQRIRLLRLEGSDSEAEKLTLEGLRSTRDPYLTCRFTLLRGLLVMNQVPGEPKEAMNYFYRALQLALESHFWWGVQAAYANLGLACYRQAFHPSTQPIAQRHFNWLEQAQEWFERNLTFCKHSGFQHDSPEAALYLCRILRLREQPTAAQTYAQAALQLAQKLNHLHSQAEALLELGELVWVQDSHAALGYWNTALALELNPTHRHHLLERIGDRRDHAGDHAGDHTNGADYANHESPLEQES
jgi:tetratricopeptide (TPR) repeat protein